MLKLAKYSKNDDYFDEDFGNDKNNKNKEIVVNIRDKMQTKNKNAYNKKIGKFYWLRKFHEKRFLEIVFEHSYIEHGLSIAGILNYVKSGEFENDIMQELIKREKNENTKGKDTWGRTI